MLHIVSVYEHVQNKEGMHDGRAAREEALRGFCECFSGSKLVHSAALRVTTGLKDLLDRESPCVVGASDSLQRVQKAVARIFDIWR